MKRILSLVFQQVLLLIGAERKLGISESAYQLRRSLSAHKWIESA